ncbi:MAG TPA: cystathionine beta-lyase [Acetobacteraceae bacterium]|jgi:cystathionine beta-lyase|nr:cystathionine beta-lyase [Acetobacteraceae bacterium]
MADDMTPPGKPGFYTRLSHAGRAGTNVRGFVNPPVYRGSTMLYPKMADRLAAANERLEQKAHYGTGGGPTHWPLENMIAEIEGGTRCQIVSTGLAAVTVPLLAYLKAGDHMLMPDSAYGPTRNFCDNFLDRFGVATTYYDPCITAEALAPMFQPNTTVLYTESPGSHTFEVQDVPALAALAHSKGAKVLMDNTWGIHYFQPFRHGVDVSIQALTKYVCGHSDVLLGGITVNSDEDWARVRGTASTLGQYASPDDCWLALRGVRTMGVRLDRQQASALEVARWLAARNEVAQVLHPALPGAPGHAIWKRDFTGACSLFGVVFKPGITQKQVHAMADALQLFGKGASWGGYESLALPTTVTRTANSGDFGGQMMRLHIGLEDPADLIADLAQGFEVLTAAA